MGLIRVAMSALGSTISDQWLEVFTCETLGTEVLVKKGAAKTSGGKNRGDVDVISSGSKINVPEGTALLLVDQGKVVDFTTEAGVYTWDSSSAPSMLGGGKFGDKFTASLEEIGRRFTTAGVVSRVQQVYFVNMLEILDNKFGTPSPMPYDDPTYRGIYIRLNGIFSFRIVNPVAFFQSISGNVSSVYERSTLMTQIKTEFVSKFTEVLNRCATVDKIQYNRIPSEQSRLTQYMNDALDDSWLQLRGLEVVSVGIGGITPDDASRKRMEDFDRDILLSANPDMLAARMGASTAEAMVAAGSNEAGAATGLLGLGMLGGVSQAAGGAQSLNYFEKAKANQVSAEAAGGAGVDTLWTCSCGYAQNKGKFCAECGKAKPEPVVGWTCSCGQTGNLGKFCTECGRPAEAQPKGCQHCGWKAAVGDKEAKFCPQCGKPIE